MKHGHIVAAVLGIAAIAHGQSISPSVPGGGSAPTNGLRGARGTATLDFAEISPTGVSETLTVPVPGAEVGQAAQCNALGDLSAAALVVVSQWVSGSGEVSVNLFNPSSSSPVDLGPMDFSCFVVE